MSGERLFLDTSFVQALLDRRDQYHPRAKSLRPVLDAASRVRTTEAVLVEVGNALGAYLREAAVAFIDSCYETDNIEVVPIDTPLLKRAVRLYEMHQDKSWGLTDCLSFLVMRENGLTLAMSSDRHFIQAGFRALLLEEGP
jgi:predicted nucleic acid-binding protein